MRPLFANIDAHTLLQSATRNKYEVRDESILLPQFDRSVADR